jgi:hypothetical protein
MLLFKIETNYSIIGSNFGNHRKEKFVLCVFLFIFSYFKPFITLLGCGIQPVDYLYIQAVVGEALVKKAFMG